MRLLRMSVSAGILCAIALGLWFHREGMFQSLVDRVTGSAQVSGTSSLSPPTGNAAANLQSTADTGANTQSATQTSMWPLTGSIPVTAIGGSAAYGWDDTKSEGGYLARTFRDLSGTSSGNTYAFTNASVEGRGPVQFVDTLPSILQADKPKLVVISFGMLDDLYKRTPQKQLNAALVQEVNDALATHAVVAFVTPPVTGASYSEFKHTEWPSLQSEMKAVEHIQNPNVHVIDLFSQMKNYLSTHNQTVQMYAADGWHPNAAGHQLAASLLEQDLSSSVWF